MLIDPICFYDEVWTIITDEMVPNIKPQYEISNFGRVRRFDTNMILNPRLCGHGYYQVHLQLNDGSWISKIVSRLVGMAFCRPDDLSIQEIIEQKLQVNHEDGIKINNRDTNLSWCTPKENMIHSFQNDLGHRGERMYKSVLTDSQVHDICRLLQDTDYSYVEINRILGLGLSDPTKYISEIKLGVKWKHISSQYNIRRERRNQLFTDDIAKEIFELLSINPDTSANGCISILNHIGIPFNSSSLVNYKRVIRAMKNGEAYKHIGVYYGF